ncbi:helix-turn-helix domain-containing protein [Pseudaminobacter sp. NGMCC 1.201702]|uniref:helix-turn-helix domain-containing protein n=1 Tax=Pseudaminobacter sp. NGMCC 1.201702 TaxID=3391825 RepID=UPI0039F08E22
MFAHGEAYALTIPDFARRFGVGRSKVYLEIQAGRLKPRKVGTRTIIPVEEARRWLEALPKMGATSHGK